MSTLAIEVEIPRAVGISITEETLSVDLSDGRSIAVPTGWYPRLLYGSQPERDNWRLIGRGHGIHWPDLDEDVSVEALLEGRPSKEGPKTFKRWLEARRP